MQTRGENSAFVLVVVVKMNSWSRHECLFVYFIHTQEYFPSDDSQETRNSLGENPLPPAGSAISSRRPAKATCRYKISEPASRSELNRKCGFLLSVSMDARMYINLFIRINLSVKLLTNKQTDKQTDPRDRMDSRQRDTRTLQSPSSMQRYHWSHIIQNKFGGNLIARRNSASFGKLLTKIPTSQVYRCSHHVEWRQNC